LLQNEAETLSVDLPFDAQPHFADLDVDGTGSRHGWSHVLAHNIGNANRDQLC
jgi:hypothetical protein